jgi:hypothetical protein
MSIYLLVKCFSYYIYHDNRLRLEVPSQEVTIASLFRLMESNQVALKLEDYSISQTSLEQVFNVHAAEDDQRKKERMDANKVITMRIRSL